MLIGLLLAKQIAQLFLILLLGYALVRCGLLKSSDSRVISVIMVYLALPCMVLNAFQIEDTPATRMGLIYALAVAAVIHVLFLALTWLLSRWLHLDAVESTSVIYSNAGVLVVPLVQALLGQEYVIYTCGFIIIQLFLLWTHGAFVLQGGGKLQWKAILENVNLISVVVGALIWRLHIQLPEIILGTVSSLGNMVGPVGMLLAGMAIAEQPLRRVFCTPRNYLATALRLIVYPLAVLALIYLTNVSALMPDSKPILMIVYLASITPVCATITSMAQLYGLDSAHSSALYVLSTMLSVFTMPVMIGAFDILIK